VNAKPTVRHAQLHPPHKQLRARRIAPETAHVRARALHQTQSRVELDGLRPAHVVPAGLVVARPGAAGVLERGRVPRAGQDEGAALGEVGRHLLVAHLVHELIGGDAA